MAQNFCILISGLLGSHAVEIADIVADRMDNTVVVSGGGFLISKAPMPFPTAILSTGEQVQNSFCAAAISWNKLNKHVTTTLRRHNVVLVAYPREDLMTFHIDAHIRITLGLTPEDEIQRLLVIRRQLCAFKTAHEITRDEMKVREVIYPEYLETVQHFHGTVALCIEKRPISEIVDEIMLIYRYLTRFAPLS